MNWIKEYKLIKNLTALGKREAQVLSLKHQGYSPKESVEQIEQKFNTSPTIETIRSIRSQLKRKKIQTNFQMKFFNDDIENTFAPDILMDNEFDRDLTIHAYIGKIGSGKTATASSHATELLKNNSVTTVDWFSTVSKQDEQFSSSDINTFYSELDEYTTELINRVEEYTEDENVILYIDAAHILNKDKFNLLKKHLRDSEANISVRLITQKYSDISEYEVEIYYLFRNSEYISEFEIPISLNSLHVGTKKEQWTEFFYINKVTDIKDLKCVTKV